MVGVAYGLAPKVLVLPSLLGMCYKLDNIAANILKRTFGYRTFRDYASSLGCTVTGDYANNQTTAREMGIILEHTRDFAATNSLGEEVISYLCNNFYRSRIPAGIPSSVRVGNKTGDYEDFMNDAAIIFLDGITCTARGRARSRRPLPDNRY